MRWHDHWKTHHIPTPAQARAARAVTGIGIRELAKAAGTTTKTVVNYITHGREVAPSIVTAIQRVFEQHGIEFYRTDEGRPGLRLPPRNPWDR